MLCQINELDEDDHKDERVSRERQKIMSANLNAAPFVPKTMRGLTPSTSPVLYPQQMLNHTMSPAPNLN